jgi:hypothetical protein
MQGVVEVEKLRRRTVPRASGGRSRRAAHTDPGEGSGLRSMRASAEESFFNATKW